MKARLQAINVDIWKVFPSTCFPFIAHDENPNQVSHIGYDFGEAIQISLLFHWNPTIYAK